jgi:hypothetical protein
MININLIFLPLFVRAMAALQELEKKLADEEQ